MGRLDAGGADADAAIRLDPAFASAYATRAHIKEVLNEKHDAIADFRKALSITPSMQEAKDGLIRLGATSYPA
jgi:Tfp pilus assembly protein PilF